MKVEGCGFTGKFRGREGNIYRYLIQITLDTLPHLRDYRESIPASSPPSAKTFPERLNFNTTEGIEKVSCVQIN